MVPTGATITTIVLLTCIFSPPYFGDAPTSGGERLRHCPLSRRISSAPGGGPAEASGVVPTSGGERLQQHAPGRGAPEALGVVPTSGGERLRRQAPGGGATSSEPSGALVVTPTPGPTPGVPNQVTFGLQGHKRDTK